MKHIVNYNIFEAKVIKKSIKFEDLPKGHAFIMELCRKYKIKDYTINDDNSIDVGSPTNTNNCVNLHDYGFTKLPLVFNNVYGDFSCGHNQLKSLEGAPKYVDGACDFSNNQLEDLTYCPKNVQEELFLNNNNIKDTSKLNDVSCRSVALEFNKITNISNDVLNKVSISIENGIGSNPFDTLLHSLISLLHSDIEYGSEKYDNAYLDICGRLDEFEVIKNQNQIDVISLNQVFDFMNKDFNIKEVKKELNREASEISGELLTKYYRFI